MASFLVHLPVSCAPMSLIALQTHITKRGLECTAESNALEQCISFTKSHDVIFCTLKDGVVEIAELNPDYLSKPPVCGYICEALHSAGYEYVDEDDPRWPATTDE